MAHLPQSLQCDLLIVGGGINGAGIARDAAGRGLSVVLCEKDDIAAHTSSASTKLIHGGLRYLEHYEFALVRKALLERERLLRAAPHIIRPLQFVMPHDRGQRPAWMIGAGLFLYDRLARRELLPASRRIDLRTHDAGQSLDPRFTHGFLYADCRVDDARLVVLNALDAAERGARILPRTRCVAVRRANERWHAELRRTDGAAFTVQARCLVNAAGPWAAQFLQHAAQRPAQRPLRLVKGSHIVVRRLFAHPYAYLFQHPDGRIVFAIPYEDDFTLIGTTEIDYRGNPDAVVITADEVAYLCTLASRYLVARITPADVVWSYSGVRPLVDDAASTASAVTRDYRLELEADGDAPLLSVFGGKLTTFRKLAEETVDLLCRALGIDGRPWTAGAWLPGGDLSGQQPDKDATLAFERFARDVQRRYAWLPAAVAVRYAHAYGTRVSLLLAGRTCIADMGEEILAGLYEAEADYLIRHEWALCADDILWRRTKLGLHLPADAHATLAAWLNARRPATASEEARAQKTCGSADALR